MRMSYFLSNELNESRLEIESFWRHANSSRSRKKNCVLFYKYANENDAKILWKLNITIHIYIAYGTHGFTHMYAKMCVKYLGSLFLGHG